MPRYSTEPTENVRGEEQAALSILSTRLERATRAAERRKDRAAGPRIVLVEPDPYLAFLLRLNFPQADVVELDPAANVDTVLGLEPDLVIVGVGTASMPVADLLEAEPAPKILAVVDGSRAARTAITTGVDRILTRPFVPADLQRTVRVALGWGDPEEAPGLPGHKLLRARSLAGPARLAALAIAAVLEVGAEQQVSSLRATILALAFVYGTARWVIRRPSVVWVGADVAVAAAFVAATEGISSPYIPFALVVAATTGLTHDERWGGIAGLIIAASSTSMIVTGLRDTTLHPQEVVAWYALTPLAGITGGFASRVWRTTTGETTSGLLAEANRVLSSLYRIARTLPGGLEIGTVADATMQEIRDTVRASAGCMLLWEAGNLAVVGSYGLRNPDNVAGGPATDLAGMVHGSARVVTHTDLDKSTAQALGGFECWLLAPMRRTGVPLGLLLAACPDHDQHAANRLLLQSIAQETAVAVENARLFSRVREISIDEERKRLARELHDGVAQALTHLRFELDFMARHGGQNPDAVKREIERLARVVNRASGDVRSMIFGLRSSVSAEGIVGSLRAYLSDLRGLGGPDIVFEARGEVRLPAGVEAEIFRIAQEAVSNAIRHASATQVRVTLIAGASVMRLIVEDDGVGMKGRRGVSARGGVGLEAMRERTDAIGATIDLGERPGGGTRVRLEYRTADK
jgi:signal transduction histidine kinase/CheY-like chemotaxis protein